MGEVAALKVGDAPTDRELEEIGRLMLDLARSVE